MGQVFDSLGRDVCVDVHSPNQPVLLIRWYVGVNGLSTDWQRDGECVVLPCDRPQHPQRAAARGGGCGARPNPHDERPHRQGLLPDGFQGCLACDDGDRATSTRRPGVSLCQPPFTNRCVVCIEHNLLMLGQC